MKKVLFYFAIAGLVLGLIVHILALSGIDVADKIPFVWLLHVGIFLVLFPTFFYLNQNKDWQEYQQAKRERRKTNSGFFKIIFKGSPRWVKAVFIGGLIYGILNFFLFGASSPAGTPSIEGEQYILHNRGKFIKNITEEEYHQYKANELRGFSGHWLLLYGFAAIILSSLKRAEEENTVQ